MKKHLNSIIERMIPVLSKHFLVILFVTAGIYACQNEEPETKVSAIDEAGQSAAVMKPRNTTAREGAVFTKDVGGPISEETAQKWITNYRMKYPDGTRWQYFGSNTYLKQINQTGAVGIKLIYTINDDGAVQVVMIAVDEKGNELKGSDFAGYADVSNLCPTDCGSI